MFVRVKKRSNGSRAVQIVQSHRRGDKVSQHVVRHIGQAYNDDEEKLLRGLASRIIIELKNERQPALPIFSPEKIYDPEVKREASKNSVELENLREDQRIIVGIGDVFGKLYRDLSLDTVLKSEKENEKEDEKVSKKASEIRKDKQWNAILKTCVLARIANPSSKRETASFLEKDYGLKIDLDKIYRMMDHVASCEDRIKKRILETTLGLFGDKLNILFFDVTTLYFESVIQDDLKDFGFSKDNKFNEVQVVLALVTTERGIPAGYETFPGNTFEGNTLIKVVLDLKSKYNIKDVTLAADRGMFSEKNLALLEKEGIRYIVGAKLKKMGKDIEEEIFNDEGYDTDVIFNQLHWYKEIEYKKRRLIVSYNSRRAKKDASDRRKLVDRLMKKANEGKIKIKDIIPNRGTKKYLKVTDGKAGIDEDKIASDANWDGLYGIITNSVDDRKPQELIGHYRRLWEIEDAFRVNKHDLRMRPIYHWKPERIKGHIAILLFGVHLDETGPASNQWTKYNRNGKNIFQTIKRRVASCSVQHIIRRRKPKKISSSFKGDPNPTKDLQGL